MKEKVFIILIGLITSNCLNHANAQIMPTLDGSINTYVKQSCSGGFEYEFTGNYVDLKTYMLKIKTNSKKELVDNFELKNEFRIISSIFERNDVDSVVIYMSNDDMQGDNKKRQRNFNSILLDLIEDSLITKNPTFAMDLMLFMLNKNNYKHFLDSKYQKKFKNVFLDLREIYEEELLERFQKKEEIDYQEYLNMYFAYSTEILENKNDFNKALFFLNQAYSHILQKRNKKREIDYFQAYEYVCLNIRLCSFSICEQFNTDQKLSALIMLYDLVYISDMSKVKWEKYDIKDVKSFANSSQNRTLSEIIYFAKQNGILGLQRSHQEYTQKN